MTSEAASSTEASKPAAKARRLDDLRCLVLNADGLPLATWPLSIIPVEDAICSVIRDRAVVVAEWDTAFHSPSIEIRAPKAIMLRSYANIHAAPRFCRRSILLRDHYECQYCGERFPAAELTFDHVIPREHGGKTTWENILSCCVECNARKKNLLPKWNAQKGHPLRPLKEPRQPTAHELRRAGLQFLSPEIKEEWGSFLYWEQPLEP